VTRLLLATRNVKKLAELQRILVAERIHGIEVIGLAAVPPFPEAPETGATFEDNALAKARDAAAATGLPAIADDSGLAVDALNGMPGVLSARWSGKHGDDLANLELVLAQLTDVPKDSRGAAFVCAAALVTPTGEETVVRADWHGTLTHHPRGTHGFGYDPIFIPGGYTQTSAELEPSVKDGLSHRGQALRLLAPRIGPLT